MWDLADSDLSMTCCVSVSHREGVLVSSLILTCLTKGSWPCDAQSPHLGLEFLSLAFWPKIPFCFLQSLGYCQPACIHSLLLSTAKCLIFHLWLTGLPDTTIHKAKPLVLACKSKSSTISTPTLDYFCPITACAPAYQGYFLCPWEQGFQMLEGSRSLSGEVSLHFIRDTQTQSKLHVEIQPREF